MSRIKPNKLSKPRPQRRPNTTTRTKTAAAAVDPAARPRCNIELERRARELSAKFRQLASNWRDCECPSDCPGAHGAAARAPDPEPEAQPGPPRKLQLPRTPEGRSRYPVINVRTYTRVSSRVIEEARGTTTIQLPRLGDTAAGTLRMSVQVHPCPDGYKTRMGYYGEFYLERPGERDVHAGIIAAWRISKPNERFPQANDAWAKEWLDPAKDMPSAEAAEFADEMRILFQEDGRPSGSINSYGANAHIPGDLGDRGTELVFISLVWVNHDYSGNGILGHALELFYRLLTGGTLLHYNIGGRVTFLLEPGKPNNAVISRMWPLVLPRQEGESEMSWELRIKTRLTSIYGRYHYKPYVGRLMGRVVEPQACGAGDQLLATPDPPPLGPAAVTPDSTLSRAGSRGGDSLEALYGTPTPTSQSAGSSSGGGYIPLS